MNNKKDVIKRATMFFVAVLLIIIVGFLMIKYEIEGETNLSFKLSKIMIISTADGRLNEENNISVSQSNDLYLTIEKVRENNEMIKNVYIENIKVMSEPKKGTVNLYKPNNTEGEAYVYKDEFLIEDSLTYVGDSKTSMKELTISNQGGTISFRTCLENIGIVEVDQNADTKNVSYINEGTLLKDAKIEISDIQYNIGFDVIIELTDGKMYKGYVNLSLPVENVEKDKVQGVEKANTNDIIFKRIKIK